MSEQIGNSAENKKAPTGTIGASLLRYLHFLILKEIEPRRDTDIVEKMRALEILCRIAERIRYLST